jgi:cell division protein FtsZ
VSMEGARGVLLNLTGSPDLTLNEINEAAELIRQAADSEANIIFGAVVDPRMQDEVKLTVIATGFDSRAAAKPSPLITDRLRSPAIARVAGEREILDALPAAGPLANEDLEVPSFLRKHIRDRRP